MLDIKAITAQIATLSVPGVTISDIEHLKDAYTSRDCPIMFPDPSGIITSTIITTDTYGHGGSAKKSIAYDIPYVFLHSMAGDGRGLYDKIYDALAKIGLIITAVTAFDTLNDTVLDATIVSIPAVGNVLDASNNNFIGATFNVRIKEFVN